MAAMAHLDKCYECRSSSLHGRGLFATRNISAHETVFCEAPLVAMQTLTNRREVPVCAACLGPLSLPPCIMMSVLIGSITPQDLAQRCDIAPCTKECGELYCSIQCRDKAWNTSHKLLCVGEISEEDAESHPLVELKILAVTTNEILLLAIQVVAEMVLRHESREANNRPFTEYAISPFAEFVRKPWWEVAKAPKGTDAEELKESLLDLCERTSKLLKQSFGIVPGGIREALINHVHADLLGSIVGTFEQNNVGIRCRSPLRPWADRIVAQAKAGETQPLIAIAEPLMKLEDMVRESCDEACEVGGEVVDGEVDVEDPDTLESLIDLVDSTTGDDIDPLFTPLDGTALFTTTCIMNHSCSPNVMIAFLDANPPNETPRTPTQSVQPLQIQVTALKEIAAGEEICFSYISSDMPPEERSHALSEYDIICFCGVCSAGET